MFLCTFSFSIANLCKTNAYVLIEKVKECHSHNHLKTKSSSASVLVPNICNSGSPVSKMTKQLHFLCFAFTAHSLAQAQAALSTATAAFSAILMIMVSPTSWDLHCDCGCALTKLSPWTLQHKWFL